ncbi:16S rRNA (cytosine(1402)-N(4))-methyltransferase RsmH [Rhodohalobacter sp. 8-1]|uniref:16S rRNA (cytosine(1402)-N(4))-methyltransferase RsmH n=1 Tax=Rhodohalobacter sp. 8-1 TaxID=3131972 RepID=UPI0030ECF222
MSYIPHVPVLLKESIEYLVTDPNGIYVDATLGGGGHSKEILSALSDDGRLFGLDQDAEAHKAAALKIGDDSRFTPISGNFGYLKTLINPDLHGKITGIFYDLGVSTHQIKEGDRGFSFMEEGPLDMRMSALTGLTAHQVVNEYSYEKLRDIIFHYGEERFSREIAQEIISRRPLETTHDLREAVSSVVFGKHTIKSIARVFQGIRIEVNRELDVLKESLEQAIDILKMDGRIVAISYHSLEDRIVKNFFKSGNESGKIEKDFYGNPQNPLTPITKNIVTPSEEEIKANPAARSAKLRAAVKTGESE